MRKQPDKNSKGPGRLLIAPGQLTEREFCLVRWAEFASEARLCIHLARWALTPLISAHHILAARSSAANARRWLEVAFNSQEVPA